MADDDDQTDLVPRHQIRQLEEQAAKSRQLEEQLAQMQRESAFARALGSTDHPARQYFERGYDGELDVESIRTAARDAGLIGNPVNVAPAEQTNNQPTPAEMAAHARMAAASDGGGGNRPTDLIEAMGPRGTHKPDELLDMLRASGRRLAEDQ
jgi:hypothetical protein